MRRTLLLIFFSATILFLPSLNRSYHYISVDYLPPLYSNNNNFAETAYFYRVISPKLDQDIKPLSNKLFPYSFSYLNQNDVYKLRKINQLCKPVSYGYNEEKGKKVFPDYFYPKCEKVTGKNSTNILISKESGQIKFNCNEKFLYVMQGPLENLNMMKKIHVKDIKLLKSSQSSSLSNTTEYLFSFCSKTKLKSRSSISQSFHGAQMFPRPNPSLQAPSPSPSPSIAKKAKTIFLLTLDSISRSHFYRKLPITTSYLNSSPNLLPNLSIFDFKLHSTYSRDSITNQAPIFGGRNYKLNLNHSSSDKLGERSLWSIFKQKGFITLFGLDDCDREFTDVLGTDLKVDYAVRQFYCISEKYLKVFNSKKNQEQRCIGPHQVHYYLLNYTLELIDMYKDKDLWIYLHLNAAHEKTGQHAATLDLDLKEFLVQFFRKSEDREVFVVMAGDHGMRYGEWYHSVEAYQETKMPAMFVMTSQSWMAKWDKSFHCLSENSWRLTSKLDIRKTVLALVGVEEEDERDFAVNLVDEIASYGRTCSDINVKPSYCACSHIEKLNSFGPELKFLFRSIRQHIQNLVNSFAYSSPLSPGGLYCNKIILTSTKNVFHVEIDRFLEIFILEFSSKTRAKFKVTLLIGSDYERIKKEESKFNWFELTPNDIRFMIKVMKIQVLDIERLDKYGGPFESLIEKVGISAMFCVPSDYLLLQDYLNDE